VNQYPKRESYLYGTENIGQLVNSFGRERKPSSLRRFMSLSRRIVQLQRTGKEIKIIIEKFRSIIQGTRHGKV